MHKSSLGLLSNVDTAPSDSSVSSAKMIDLLIYTEHRTAEPIYVNLPIDINCHVSGTSGSNADICSEFPPPLPPPRLPARKASAVSYSRLRNNSTSSNCSVGTVSVVSCCHPCVPATSAEKKKLSSCVDKTIGYADIDHERTAALRPKKYTIDPASTSAEKKKLSSCVDKTIGYADIDHERTAALRVAKSMLDSERIDRERSDRLISESDASHNYSPDLITKTSNNQAKQLSKPQNRLTYKGLTSDANNNSDGSDLIAIPPNKTVIEPGQKQKRMRQTSESATSHAGHDNSSYSTTAFHNTIDVCLPSPGKKRVRNTSENSALDVGHDHNAYPVTILHDATEVWLKRIEPNRSDTRLAPSINNGETLNNELPIQETSFTSNDSSNCHCCARRLPALFTLCIGHNPRSNQHHKANRDRHCSGKNNILKTEVIHNDISLQCHNDHIISDAAGMCSSCSTTIDCAESTSMLDGCCPAIESRI